MALTKKPEIHERPRLRRCVLIAVWRSFLGSFDLHSKSESSSGVCDISLGRPNAIENEVLEIAIEISWKVGDDQVELVKLPPFAYFAANCFDY
jgi:hypothetical protein